MNISPHTIGFDIDCVVADTMSAFIDLARKEYDVTIKPEQITSFQVEKCLDIPPRIIQDIFSRLLEEPLESGLQPMDHAVSVLTALSIEAPLTFITARPTKKPIDRWLHTILGESVYSKINLIATGEHDGKLPYIKNAGLHSFIDDRVPTCLELAENGFQPIVFSQPWNRGKHDLPSVENWLSIQDLFLNHGTKAQ
ncbi:MAG: hypothetical protein H8E41_13105 [Desulfobulbaceae bacterium]|uniref:Haloacid dehalogenase n=1 Tax=Candidatus Desulfobia pelagia TaxID=2841692 RepID=A0A8J6NF93_9BACT|nr:hypothetical protein [Candidatus Desulfobia pelagia]